MLNAFMEYFPLKIHYMESKYLCGAQLTDVIKIKFTKKEIFVSNNMLLNEAAESLGIFSYIILSGKDKMLHLRCFLILTAILRMNYYFCYGNLIYYRVQNNARKSA